MRRIFPNEFLEYSMEAYRFQHSKKWSHIYLALLLFLVVLVAILPFVEIELYASSPGMILPSKKRNGITIPATAKVHTLRMQENQLVKKGDTLLLLDTSLINEQMAQTAGELDTVRNRLKDLSRLLNDPLMHRDSFRTGLYRSERAEYLASVRVFRNRLHQLQKNWERKKTLFEKGVIARVEYEEALFRLREMENEFRLLEVDQKTQWQSALAQSSAKEIALFSELEVKRELLKDHIIRAPFSGNIHGLKGLEKGNLVRQGEVIAELSPNEGLVVECLVSPSDIGLLKKGDPVKFRIEAFQHQYWGMASGMIRDIQSDISWIENRPVFRVICSLNERMLHLKDRTPGKLTKGMTLQARFFIAKRTALQLLSDRLEDWYNKN